MAPPTTKPRLAAIVPAEIALETTRRVADDLARRGLGLAPGITVHLDERGGIEASGLYLSILDLCAWAQRGEGEPAEVQDLCLSVASAVYPAPLDGREGDGIPEDLAADVDPETEIGLLIVAALAREKLIRRKPVRARELAALAGVDAKHIQLLGRRGELALEDGEILAKEARRWLSARGVAGFEGRREP